MHKKISQNLFMKALESFFVITYILFEEFIWEVLAKPIYAYCKQLTLLHTLEKVFLPMNRYLLLLVFIIILSTAEAMGLLSGLLMINGYIVSAIMVYLTKIPIAALTFWLFELCKEKLLSFMWLNKTYFFTMDLIHQFVNSSIYKAVKATASKLRADFKKHLQHYLGADGLMARMKKQYWFFKDHFSRTK